MQSHTESQILILVKASPQPSRQYGDTVCVAGADLTSGIPKWIRLYPVPFRYLDGEQQFKKYDVIRTRTRDAGADKRPESRKIDAESIARISSLNGWKKRAPWVEPLAGPTMCGIEQAAKANLNAPSLAAIRPASVKGVTFARHPGWTKDQLDRFEHYRNQGDLFRESPPRLLDPPRLQVKLNFQCQEPYCKGHAPGIIDWELTALQHRYQGRTDGELKDAIRTNFYEKPFAPDRLPLIFVGNQEDIRRRASFTVLGLYYPRAGHIEQTGTLF